MDVGLAGTRCPKGRFRWEAGIKQSGVSINSATVAKKGAACAWGLCGRLEAGSMTEGSCKKPIKQVGRDERSHSLACPLGMCDEAKRARDEGEELTNNDNGRLGRCSNRKK